MSGARTAAVLVACAGLLAACGTVPQERVVVRTVTAEVPVPVGCITKPPARPAFAVDALPLGAQADEQMRALRAERLQRKGYEAQLESEVARCAGGENVR